MGNIGTWQLVIVLAIVLLLFGAKRLPEAARGLGRSLKIFKSETQGLVSGDDPDKGDADSSPQAQSAPPKAVEPGVAPQPQQAPQQPSQQSEAAGDPAQQRDA